jgi:AMIN domain-containing protein
MKSLLGIGREFFRFGLLAGALGAASCLAQAPSAKPNISASVTIQRIPILPAILRSVKVISDTEGPVVEIVTNGGQAPNPTVETLESPPRLVIDLPNTRVFSPRKKVTGDSAQVTRVRVNQFQNASPVTRVVLDLVHPVGYSTDSKRERLLVHLHPLAEARQRSPEPPSVPAFTEGVQPVAVPVSAGSSGVVMEAGSRLASDSSVTAGPDTTILHLTRGGEVRVCPATTLSVTTSQNGHDLLLGMSTGALEAHYTLNTSADSVLTPDFRMQLAGPGEFHYAISADARGNTCVRSLAGNTASVIVSELMGDDTYHVKSSEQVVFHSGRLSQSDAIVPDECGCPPPAIPAMRASVEAAPTVSEMDLPPAVHLAQPGDEPKPLPPADSASGVPTRGKPPAQVTLTITPPDAAPLPPPEPGAAQVQVEAPFVFRAADAPPSAPNLDTATLPMSRSSSQAPLLTTAEPPDAKRHQGVFHKMKGFFSRLF